MPETTINNIGYFNIVTGLVFEKLYRNFPVPIDINTASFTPQYLSDSGIKKDDYEALHYDEFANEAQIVSSILQWLLEEGYIRSTDSSSGILFCQCVLSSKGLQTLSTPISPNNPTETLGDQMVAATEKGLLDGVRDLAKIAVCEGGKFIFQSVMDSMLRNAMRP